MTELANEFAWSKKRSRNFADCKRLYWFDAYGKWPGWEASADPRTKEIYILSNLKNRWMWAGQHVHAAVATILRAYRDGELIDPSEILGGLRQRMRDEYRSSRTRKYRQAGNHKTCALREHEYDEKVEDAQWEKAVSKGESCLRHFIGSKIFDQLKRVPSERWLTIDEDPPASFVFDGVKVWVKIDAAHKTEEGRIRIIDWKTGSTEDEWAPLQLAVYSLYAMDSWKAPPESIVVGLADLSDPSVAWDDRMIERAELEAAREHIRNDVRLMEGLLSSDRTQNAAVEENFPGTDKPRTCESCNFHRICPVTPQKRPNGSC